MTITIINDCSDQNAQARQITRAAALLNGAVSFVSVANDLEAAGNLIDALDAGQGSSGAVLVNVAPRNGAAKKWENGTPFGYFWYKETLVLSTVDGLALSLVKKFNLTQEISVLDVADTVEVMIQKGAIDQALAVHIAHTQFRSYEFLPRVAALLLNHGQVNSKRLAIADIVDAPYTVWWVDNFGNCKTTLLADEVKINDDGTVSTQVGNVPYFARLKDVPDGTCALVQGSSGLGQDRFLEIVLQGGNAARTLALHSGSLVL